MCCMPVSEVYIFPFPLIDKYMSSDRSGSEGSITEEKVRQGFERMYRVSIEEVMGALRESLEENHHLLKKFDEASGEFEEAGFTEDEKDSMQGIQDYVDGRD
jgi:hypothetical protein